MKKSGSRRIVLVVSNDLEGDQRLHKMAGSLQKKAWDLLLIGRMLPDSLPLSRPYKVKRLKLLFKKGPVFYACFNIRIFFRLLFTRASLFVANDLDTLTGVWCASKLRRIPIVYDSHEYFTRVPELESRKKVQKIWKYIERRIQPRLKHIITVNDSIAAIFRNEYKQDITVIKNMPLKSPAKFAQGNLPSGFSDNPIIIYQGAVNMGRGLEELIKAMPYLEEFNLLLVGGGDLLESLKLIVDQELNKRIHFTGRIPFESLGWYTAQASIGVSLEQDMGLNYRLSLPNKLFDYLHAGLPVVASDLPEIRKLVEDVDFGLLVSDFSPVALSKSIRSLWEDKKMYKRFRENALARASEYMWEGQEDKLLEVYEKALQGF
ncbi:MAG: glycosyltransferase family 4 protein [Cyclobacteriaceae bacterium]|nr:glycosyltransferase family 4 protein [Cyclobacteriaceae bacterium]